MVVDDTTRMNVRWKTGSQVKSARAKTLLVNVHLTHVMAIIVSTVLNWAHIYIADLNQI